jgi:hypothetical protein
VVRTVGARIGGVVQSAVGNDIGYRRPGHEQRGTADKIAGAPFVRILKRPHSQQNGATAPTSA